ncbi:MAG: hypothetical protein ACRCW2_05910 [Cellulosilyticaceae bacterium]
MIRPIDTQILYPQAPELSNRQQVNKQLPENQQQQFAQIMQKESEVKKEKVQEVSKDAGIKNDPKEKKEKGSDEKQSQNQQRKKQEKEKINGYQGPQGRTIDIKI